MAMKKAEMEAHQEQYQSLMRRSREAERGGSYDSAVKLAVKSWEHVEGMIQCVRRAQGAEIDRIAAFDMALKYAPVLFEFSALTSLEQFLEDNPRIRKNMLADPCQDLQKSRRRMWQAHTLWTHIEQTPDCRQDSLRQHLGDEQEVWRSIAEQWEQMGLLSRVPDGGSYRLSFTTQMEKIVSAKCQSCGVTVQAPKRSFLEKAACPDCRKTAFFTILKDGLTSLTE